MPKGGTMGQPPPPGGIGPMQPRPPMGGNPYNPAPPPPPMGGSMPMGGGGNPGMSGGQDQGFIQMLLQMMAGQAPPDSNMGRLKGGIQRLKGNNGQGVGVGAKPNPNQKPMMNKNPPRAPLPSSGAGMMPPPPQMGGGLAGGGMAGAGNMGNFPPPSMNPGLSGGMGFRPDLLQRFQNPSGPVYSTDM